MTKTDWNTLKGTELPQKDEYPSLEEERALYVFKCPSCGAYVKKGALQCYRCDRVFSEQDVDTMIKGYRENRRKNWHLIIYFAGFFFGVLAFLILLRTSA